ncbi:hypothetical protein [Microbacterium sp. KNMS]
MGKQGHLIEVPGTLPPWSLAFELAESMPERSWALVGGLMVQAHALRAGIEEIRPTSDLDMLLNLASASVGTIGASLRSLGFSALDSSEGSPLHRFVRDEDVVDVMVARNASRAVWSLRPVLRAPGTAQVLSRLDRYTFADGARRVEIDVPNPLGALIVKSAAFVVDSRNPERHVEDLAVLSAAAGPIRRLGLEELSRKDRRHLSRVLPLMRDETHPAWSVLGRLDRQVGQRVWAAIEEAVPPGGSRRRRPEN